MGDQIYSTLDKYWIIGISVAIGCASVLLSRDAILREISRGPAYAATVVAVLVSTLFLFMVYMHACREELDLAQARKYVEFVRPPQTGEIIVIFAIALLFGGLIAFVTDLLVYAPIMFGFRLADLVALHMVRRGLRHAEAVKKISSRTRTVLDKYYLRKRHVALHVVRLLGCAVAVVLAIEAKARHSGVLSEVGWGLIIAVSLLCEYVLHRWREERRRGLALGPKARASSA